MLAIESIECSDVVGRRTFLPYDLRSRSYEARVETRALPAGVYLTIVNYRDPIGRKGKYLVPIIVGR